MRGGGPADEKADTINQVLYPFPWFLAGIIISDDERGLINPIMSPN